MSWTAPKRPAQYPHMCRDGHPQIGFSTDEELCPVCLERNRAEQAEATVAALQPWKDAIIDACVVDWVCTKEHETDPRTAVNALLVQAARIALDPAVSLEAKTLHEQIAALRECLRHVHKASLVGRFDERLLVIQRLASAALAAALPPPQETEP